MKTSRSTLVWARWAAALGALGAVASFSTNAAALPLVGVSASVRALYGGGLGDSQTVSVSVPNQPNASTDWNPYTWGVGLRGGVTLLSIYLGASFDYFAAETTKLEGTEISGGRLQFMGNFGLELGLPVLTLRPLLGIGYGQTQIDSSLGQDETTQEVVVAPALEVLYSLGLIDISGELRYNIASTDALIVGFGAGISF